MPRAGGEADKPALVGHQRAVRGPLPAQVEEADAFDTDPCLQIVPTVGIWASSWKSRVAPLCSWRAGSGGDVGA